MIKISLTKMLFIRQSISNPSNGKIKFNIDGTLLHSNNDSVTVDVLLIRF